MRNTKTQAALAAVVAALWVSGCSGSSPSSPKAPLPHSGVAAPAASKPDSTPATRINSSPPVARPDQCAHKTRDWTTRVPDGESRGPGGSISNLALNQQEEPCWDTFYIGLKGNNLVGYRAKYVSRAEVVSDAQGAPIPQVNGSAILRLAILAPLAQTSKEPLPGDLLVPTAQLHGSDLVGVWFGGASEGQTLMYIGLKRRHRLLVIREQGPRSTLIDVRFAH